MRDFRLPFVVTVACLAAAGYWGAQSGQGVAAAIVLAAILGVMEVSLSFDNAVVNASVLKDMDEKWQQIFLTVGILIAVFGMRLFFPIAIVAVATGLGMADVTGMALNRPEEYAHHLQASHVGIAAFGGVFLLLVFLSFLFNDSKELHWLGTVEERLARLGKLDSIAVVVALTVLLVLQQVLPIDTGARLTMLVSGVGGAVLFVAVSSVDSLFESEQDGEAAATAAQRNGVAGFLYLEMLDASFSFDGVIGAFALTDLSGAPRHTILIRNQDAASGVASYQRIAIDFLRATTLR